MTIQPFNQETETLKIQAAFTPLFTYLSAEKQKFFDDAYNNKLLGGIIYDLHIMPLSYAIEREYFIESFYEILQSFRVTGNFENYITVFAGLFGTDSTVEFTRTAPAHLTIDITTIIDIEFEFEDHEGTLICDHNADQIVFYNLLTSIDDRGLAQIFRACTPAGIYVDFNLN
jgi:hypothetical protein